MTSPSRDPTAPHGDESPNPTAPHRHESRNPTAPHRHELKVRFYELDPYGHLNHSAFVQFFEVGRIELLEEAGLGLDVFRAEGFQLVVTNIETAFVRSVVAGEVVTVETEVLEVRRASSIWRQRLIREGEIVARQIVRAAITDGNGRPVRAPARVADQLSPYMVAVD